MKITVAFFLSLICITLFGCNANNGLEQTNSLDNNLIADSTKMRITIGTKIFTATLYNNATATAFKATLPITIRMTELNGNEKYFDLPNALPAKASNPGTIQNGDVLLYGSNTLVVFYKTFSTSYSYTPIGRIENPSELAAALGSGNVTVTFEAD